ncbi:MULTISPECIES: hypothetical protein [unclassified Moritella]|uniref:hypothetical protein n=1 Tax=unclassified Moritella TaxID=2637987 RepID=UPI001BA8210B|nr:MULTISPECIES: hypothetical protein [unclassified Moritella]QUM83037.1 hypothetical protein HWV02_15330 [Moritella sp. 28]QUM87336.1 hypothetical protein HWV03_14970 [Moritella sp. 36]
MTQSLTPQKILTALTLTLASPMVLAHAGHDHSDPLSGLIHLLWIAPVVLAAGYAVFAIRRANRIKSTEK